jgi:hypothetical protein
MTFPKSAAGALECLPFCEEQNEGTTGRYTLVGSVAVCGLALALKQPHPTRTYLDRYLPNAVRHHKRRSESLRAPPLS